MISPKCGKCGREVEARTVDLGTGSARRHVCVGCGETYPMDQLCDVCRTAYSDRRVGLKAYRSRILGGKFSVRHCESCAPPSSIALEFKQAPVAATAKWGCLGMVALFFCFTLLMLLVSVLGSVLVQR